MRQRVGFLMMVTRENNIESLRFAKHESEVLYILLQAREASVGIMYNYG